MSVILLHQNDVYMRVIAPKDVLQELSELFTFYAENYKYHPKFKMGYWDGKIKLLNRTTGLIYAGLRSQIEEYLTKHNHDYECRGFSDQVSFSVVEAKEFIEKEVKLPKNITVRDYQLETFVHCVRNKRALIVSPTASGKSLIIYLLMKYYQKKKLIIVPTVSLVKQMASDFAEYGYDDSISQIYFGQERISANITITTWQTASKLPPEWFQDFECVIGDEAHKFSAKSLIAIASRLTNTSHKFGLTGSLSESKTSKIVLEGIFGPYKKFVSTSDLMEQGYLADLNIKCLVLKYRKDECMMMRKAKYIDEKNFIVSHTRRNNFIKNLTLSLNGNVMLLYQYVDKHGIPLHKLISESTDNRNVYLVHGNVEHEEREEIRKIVNTEKNSITIASMGCFSEGINIPNINYVILVSPSKSRIRVMQMIGRGLRKSSIKDKFELYDIADDFSEGKSSNINHTLRHFVERIRYYNEEKFKYKIYKVNI